MYFTWSDILCWPDLLYWPDLYFSGSDLIFSICSNNMRFTTVDLFSPNQNYSSIDQIFFSFDQFYLYYLFMIRLLSTWWRPLSIWPDVLFICPKLFFCLLKQAKSKFTWLDPPSFGSIYSSLNKICYLLRQIYFSLEQVYFFSSWPASPENIGGKTQFGSWKNKNLSITSTTHTPAHATYYQTNAIFRRLPPTSVHRKLTCR